MCVCVGVCVRVRAYVCASMYVQVCVVMSSLCCFSVEEMFCICDFDSVVLSVLSVLPFFFLIFLSYHLSLSTVWKYLLRACVCMLLCGCFFLFVLEY